MSFYIRKSLRAGPFRINFSKSGIGVSVGVTGFRIGAGPRGNYVHIGRKGLYYRRTLGGRPAETRSREEPLSSQIRGTQLQRIESADVLELRDSSSAALLDEMNKKHKKLPLWPIAAALSLVVLVLLALATMSGWVCLFGTPFIAIGTLLVYWRDQVAKTVVLFYELGEVAESTYGSLHSAFGELRACSRIWHIEAAGAIRNPYEWKRQAGADALVQRNRIRISYQAPPNVSTNLSIPKIPLGRRSLYFFPDRIIVYEKGRVGAVSYDDVRLEINDTRFIETERVPSDTQVINYTWQYVNKDGGPDRRFKDNRQIPIVLYCELLLSSSTGLNELIQLSRPEVGYSLAESFEELSSIPHEDPRKQLDSQVIDEKQMLREAKAAVQRGEKALCRELLEQVIEANPNSEVGWLWLSAVVNDSEEERRCLERVLELNPKNEMAQRYLRKLE